MTWQRLPEHLRSSNLARHWNRFGNPDNPKYKRIFLEDWFDDWRGIQETPLRPVPLLRDLLYMGYLMLRGELREILYRSYSFTKRVSIKNRKW